ncbi:DinB family protein [Mesorhizobium sp.]|uniref:DinB family protein n=1 Tax=Mesorhizobium sp. TaxID=1871066 RepID=UPI0026D6686A
MSTSTLLRSLLVYQAWANDELLERLASIEPRRNGKERHAALRLMNHIHVVSQIFAAHLAGVAHGYASDNTDDTPEPAQLRAAMTESDRWYLDYLETVSEQRLAEPVAFVFTDGDNGCMTRQEMLTHVFLHGQLSPRRDRPHAGRRRGPATLGHLCRSPAPGRSIAPPVSGARAARCLELQLLNASDRLAFQKASFAASPLGYCFAMACRYFRWTR